MVDRALRHLLTDITGNTHRSEFCIDKLYSPDSLRGRLGLLELRGFEMPPHPDMALVQALLVRALVARFAEEPYSAPLVRWGTALHERFLLPHFAMADLAEVVADLRGARLRHRPGLVRPVPGVPVPADRRDRGRPASSSSCGRRSSPGTCSGEELASGGTARYVDSSTERLQVEVRGFVPARHLLTCNGVAVPLQPTGTPGSYVAGVRYRAWKPWSSLHPTLEIDTPLTFDLIDRASRVSLGGATYHVVHPGGRSYDHPPVNAARGRGAAGPALRGDGSHYGGDRRRGAGRAAGLAGGGGHRLPAHPGPAAAGAASAGAAVTVLGPLPGRGREPSTTRAGSGFDEFAAPDGTVREGWSALIAGLDEFAETDLRHAQREVARLLEDDNVTYTPSPASSISIADGPETRAGRR